MKIAVAIVVAALTLTACGSGETFPMASDEGLSKIRELVAEHVDTSKYKIYEVEWREDNRDRQLGEHSHVHRRLLYRRRQQQLPPRVPAHQREVHDRWSGAERPSDQLLRLLDTARPRGHRL